MTLQSMAPAWSALHTTPKQKLVWIMLSDAVGDDDPSTVDIARLAEACCMRQKKVIRIIGELIDAGYIRWGAQRP